jgi:biotin carboxyl carrier protein
MISNLRSQLAQQDALDRLPEGLEGLPKTRADLGYPPLVTPTSQIVGVQSVLNVLSGKRYSMVTDETKRYAAGYYGRTPAPIAPKLRKQLCGDLKPISCRPADLLKPGLVKAAEELPPNTIKAEEDILSYALFPEVALGYFKWRKEGGPIPADSEATAGKVESEKLKVESSAVQDKTQSQAVTGTPVLAPLNGTFYRSDAPGKSEMAGDGAAVKAGQAVCVVEAMKLFNPIKAPTAGKITFLVEHGRQVVKGQVVASIG